MVAKIVNKRQKMLIKQKNSEKMKGINKVHNLAKKKTTKNNQIEN
jgi:hypothetical protein